MTPTATNPAGYAAGEPTHAPPWHGLVVWDVFFNALTTGLFMTAAVGELLRPEAFAPLGVWVYPLALALLLIDLTCLVLDLGDPLRFHHMLRVFKPSSPMSLGTWCLTAYSLPLTAVVAIDVAALVELLPADSSTLATARVVLLAVGLPFAFGSMAYKGVLFSTSSQPGWRDARWFGAYHVASAFALGVGVLLALALATGHARAATALRPAFAGLSVAQAVPLALLVNELRPALRARYTSWRSWLIAAGVGAVVLPLLAGAMGVGLVPASAAALASGWVVRHYVVLLPQVEHHARPQ
jgi:hypothetical protein